MLKSKQFHSLSLVVAAAAPGEFRIFKAGWNDTMEGAFLFDELAAKSVMAWYAKHATDGMIDLEHLSLDAKSPNFDPDARGAYQLELRDGELWAVNVKWTEDGSARIEQKRQRYISPVFLSDKKTKRIKYLHNVAITAQPATDGLEPLIAASAAYGGEENTMNAEQLGKIAELLGLGADANVEDVIAALTAFVQKAQGQEPADPAATDAAAMSAPAEQKEMLAARDTLFRRTGASTVIQALSTIETWQSSHETLDAEKKRLAKQRADMELGSRVAALRNCVSLGGLAFPPAVAWVDPLAKDLKPAEPYASMALSQVLAMEARFKAAKGTKTAATDDPPTSQGGTGTSFEIGDQVVQLSARELAMLAAEKQDPKEYAARKAAFTARKAG